MSLKDKTIEDGGNEEAVILAEQIDSLQDIKALADTPGGKKLIALLLEDTVSAVYKIRSGRSTNTLAEFQSYAADIDTRLGLVALLNAARANESDLLEQLQEALSQ